MLHALIAKADSKWERPLTNVKLCEFGPWFIVRAVLFSSVPLSFQTVTL